MKSLSVFFAAAFVIGLFFTVDLVAQGNEKAVSPVKGVGVVIKHGGASKVTFCWSTDEDTPASYRLKVWQLNQGQTDETAMKTNPPIVTKDVDNAVAAKLANNKHPDLMKRTVNEPDTIKACRESLLAGAADSGSREAAHPAISEKVVRGETVQALVVDNFPVCAKGSSCDYIWTVESIYSNSKTTALAAISSIPVRFRVEANGEIIPKGGELRRRVEVLKSN